MSRKTIFNSVVAIVAILITGTLAGRAVLTGSTPSELIAAGVDSRDSVPVESPTTTAAPPTTRALPAATTPPTAPRVPVTTAPVTAPPLPDTTLPVTTLAPVPTTAAPPVTAPVATKNPRDCLPICWEHRPAPAVAPSWTETMNGVTVTARIEPAAPVRGEPFTIFWSSHVDSGFCCVTVVRGLGGETLYEDPNPSCQPADKTSGSVVVVPWMAGQYSFSVGANNHYLCEGPPNAMLPGGGVSGTFWVNPAT